MVSVLAGALIQAGLLTFQPQTSRMLRRAADDSADQMIRMAEYATGRAQPSPAFTLFSIDDATYSAWGAHQLTPRGRLATIVDRLARSGPAVILLDVDLSFVDSTDPAGERALRDLIGAYPASAPPLLLVRSLYHDARPPALPQLRPTNYDALTMGKPNIIWGSPLFERDNDGKVRRWRLFVQACAGNRPVVLPALHLAAAMVLRAKLSGIDNPAEAAARLPGRLAPFGAESCDRPTERAGTIIESQGDLPAIATDHPDVSSRVLYRVGWRADAVSLGRDVPTADGLAPLVAVRPAGLVLNGDPAAPIGGMNGRVAVVGGSFTDSGDWYDTPLGPMPGGLLLINAIEALTINGTPREPSLLETIGISAIIIVMTSVMAAFLRPIVAAPLAAIGIFLIVLISLPRFQSGVVLNLALPAVGAAAYDICATLVEKYNLLRERGWRFILKESIAGAEQGTSSVLPEAVAPSCDTVSEVP